MSTLVIGSGATVLIEELTLREERAPSDACSGGGGDRDSRPTKSIPSSPN